MGEEEHIIPPKDEEELELEKLVFGDQSGFEANLRKIENLYDYSDGEEEGFVHEPLDAVSESESEDQDSEQDLFFIDENADSSVQAHSHGTDAMDIDEEVSSDEKEGEEQEAWEDSDDEKLNVFVTSTRLRKLRETHEEKTLPGKAYVARLRAQYEKIYPRPSWANSFDDSANFGDDDNDNISEAEEDAQVGANLVALKEILNSTSKFVQASTKLLPANKIDIVRLKDANFVRRSRGAIQSMAFHPTHPLLVTGGFDRTLRIYHIDGKSNQFVSSVFFRDQPIQTCEFSSLTNTNLVYVGGRRRYMNRWDISSGDVEKISRMYGQDKFQKSYEYFKISPKGTYIALLGSSGWVNLLSGQTGQFSRGFKVNGLVADYEFTGDETTLMVSNESGEFWEFDLNAPTTRVRRRWVDSGAVKVTKIRLGGQGDRWLAVGTKSGVVNVFDRTTFDAIEQGKNPSPLKEVSNLVTPISELSFSPDGQILCISSKQRKDALRLVHLPSATVFSNWPTSGTPLGRVTVTSFSPGGQMLAIGNDVGKITLWRLNHY